MEKPGFQESYLFKMMGSKGVSLVNDDINELKIHKKDIYIYFLIKFINIMVRMFIKLGKLITVKKTLLICHIIY